MTNLLTRSYTAILLLLFVKGSLASEVVFDNLSVSNRGSSMSVSGYFRQAQSFAIGASDSFLEQVSLNLINNGTTNALFVELYDGLSGHLIATLSGPISPQTGASVFTPANSTMLLSNSVYWIVAWAQVYDSPYYFWTVATDPPTVGTSPNGREIGNGDNWEHGPGDLMMRVEVVPVPSQPVILRQPSSQNVAIGSTAFFTVRAQGAPQPLGFQWYFGTNAIEAGTNAMLTLTNLHNWQSGAYTVVVTNSAGSATSDPASLSVLPGLDLNMIPALTLQGEIGWNYQIDYINVVGATNAWASLATVTITNQPQIFFDASAIGQPRRFYRLLQISTTNDPPPP